MFSRIPFGSTPRNKLRPGSTKLTPQAKSSLFCTPEKKQSRLFQSTSSTTLSRTPVQNSRNPSAKKSSTLATLRDYPTQARSDIREGDRGKVLKHTPTPPATVRELHTLAQEKLANDLTDPFQDISKYFMPVAKTLFSTIENPPYDSLEGKIDEKLEFLKFEHKEITLAKEVHTLIKRNAGHIRPEWKKYILGKIITILKSSHCDLDRTENLEHAILVKDIEVLLLDNSKQEESLSKIFSHCTNLLNRHAVKEKIFSIIAKNDLSLELQVILHVVTSKRGCKLKTDQINDLIKEIKQLEHAIKSAKFRLSIEELEEKSVEVDFTSKTPIFATGGDHKKFAKDLGILCAVDKQGVSDFEKESALSKYVGNTNSKYLKDCTSFQVTLSKDETALINETQKLTKPSYAKVAIYDKVVETNELDRILTTLSKAEILEIVEQYMLILEEFYRHNVSHGDLHMHNALIHRLNGKIRLKIIDFGKALYGDNNKDKLTDIKYMFSKLASGIFETIKRNNIRSKDSPEQMKHYPFHKLASQIGIGETVIEEFLKFVGKDLAKLLEPVRDVGMVTHIFAKYRSIMRIWFCTQHKL